MRTRSLSKQNALVGQAHVNGLPVTLSPLGGEHLLSSVCHLGRGNAAHALLAIALVSSCLSVELPFAVPRRLNLHVNHDVQLAKHFSCP
jgi:hypothetical protein